LLEVVAETGSTNADIAARLRSGEDIPEGYWLVADRQTAGKGRRGREWHDGAGNFMGSTVIHLRDDDTNFGAFNIPISVALRDAVAGFVPDPSLLMLKWPNDLLLDRAKLAGVLMELVGDKIIVGIGVNLASAPHVPNRRTAAIVDVAQQPRRNDFGDALADAIARWLLRFREDDGIGARSRWLEYAHPRGTRLRVSDSGGEPIEGDFMMLAPNGSLVLRMAKGPPRPVHVGDVELVEVL